MAFNNILCVCTGNICRSPLAEGLLRKALPDANIGSAGIGAVEGGKMPEEAQAIADRETLALDDHRGRQITSPIIRGSDLVIVMEQGQLDWITGRFPESRGRVYLATHWTTGKDIDDPFRESGEFFERVFLELRDGLDTWVQRLAPSRAKGSNNGRST